MNRSIFILLAVILLSIKLDAQPWAQHSGIRIPTRITGAYDGAISMGVAPYDYNAIRADQGGTIHFFHPNWAGGAPQNSAGSINLDPDVAVTFGPWNNPVAYFRDSDGFVGIGTSQPSQRLDVNGAIQTKGIKIPGRYEFGQESSAIEIEIGTNDFNVIRGFNGTQYIGNIHFFDDTYMQGDPGKSAGGINIDGLMAITIGAWFNPMVYFRKSDGFMGLGTTAPQSKLHIEDNLNDLVRIQSSAGGAGNTAGIDFCTFPGSGKVARIEAKDKGDYNGDLVFYTDGDNARNNNVSERMRITSNGKVGIGTDDPGSAKLAVAGKIASTEVVVEISPGQGPDYVFEKDYKLRTLKDTKAYIENNKHLPEIASAKEMEENGIDLGDMNMRLLKKIEELTLYQIELLERLEKSEKRISQLESVSDSD